MRTVYCLGYTGRQPAEIKELVEALGALLIDVRYSPRSRVPHWSGGRLAALVGQDRYRHVPSLGNANYKNPDSPIVLVDPEAGVEALAPILAERPIMLLCACADYRRCHRTVAAALLADRLGARVEQIDGLQPFLPRL